jgi:hypothetical protein
MPKHLFEGTIAEGETNSSLPDVEEVTKKTGNFKRYPIFVEMLVTAAKRVG